MSKVGELIKQSAPVIDNFDALENVKGILKNGLHPGYSTGWNGFDNYFKFPPFGQLNVLTGAPGSGKSEWLDSLALNMAINHNWKVFYYSPENNPIEFHMMKILEKISGRPFYGKWNGFKNMVESDIDKYSEKIINNFIFINSQIKASSVEEIVNSIILNSINKKVNMVVIDPWNKVENAVQSRMTETDHIGRCLSNLQIVARKNNISFWVVAHPSKPSKDKDGKNSKVTLYDISGSANWYNMSDNAFVLNREWEDRIGTNQSNMRIAKIKDRRYGKCGETKFTFEPWCSRFTDCV